MLNVEEIVFRRGIFGHSSCVNRLVVEELQNQSIGSRFCEEKDEFY